MVDAVVPETFEELRDAKAAQLAVTPITPNTDPRYNPKAIYSNYVSPDALNTLVLKDPVVAAAAVNEYGQEWLDKRLPFVNQIIEQKVNPYKLAPIEYDMYERHPEYMRRMDVYNSQEAQDLRLLESQGYDPTPFNPLDQRELDKRSEPNTGLPFVDGIFGLDRAKEIASLGFDPANEFDTMNADLKLVNPVLKMEKIFGDTDKTGFRGKIALGPRDMTKEDYEFIGNQYGLKGDYGYINPGKPNLGVYFKPEGTEDRQILNSPYLNQEDFANFFLQEFPSIAGDLGLTMYSVSKMTTPVGMTGGVLGKGAKILGMSGASALGATTGDFLRLAYGYSQGAHDRDIWETLGEAGVIGAWSFGGTAVISSTAQLFAKAWKMITKTDVPPSYFDKIDDLLQDSKTAEMTGVPTPGVLYGDEISVNTIRKQLNLLGEKFGKDFSKYNPTIPSQAGTTQGADLEILFLKYADDPELREVYKQIREGNQQVIADFIEILRTKIGPSTNPEGLASQLLGERYVTGAEVSESLRVLGQREIDAFNEDATAMIDRVRAQVGGADDSVIGGQSLLTKVDNPKISSGPLFNRTQKRIKAIKDEYIVPFNEAWRTALNSPRYADLKTGAGFTRGPTEKWLRQRKAETNQLFRAADADETVSTLFELIPSGARNTISRLRGKNPKGSKFENPQFNIQELNNARVALNDFASNLPEGKKSLFKAARELEHGIEDQMNRLIREGASRESNIPLTSRLELDNYIKNEGYGDDLITSWRAQGEAIQLSNTNAIKSILAQDNPEKVIPYILNTSTKGSKTNTTMLDFMKVLKTEGSDEIVQIREGLAAYIQREVLNNPDLSAMQIARNYRKFVKDNEGTLKAVFGDKQFVSRFMNPKQFQKEIIGGLEKINTDITRIEARFGLAKTGDPDKKMTNIVESILDAGNTQKQSGSILEDITYLRTILDDNPELDEQVAQVTKRYLLDEILRSRQGVGGAFELDDQAINKLITEGFGPEEIVGPRLTFDNFMIPLLGKEGPEFVKNFKILNGMIQRELGASPSEQVARELSGDYVVGNNLQGARMLQKLLIAPLTQLGRRITAISNNQAEASRKLIGQMLLDPKLFKETMKMAQGRQSTQNYIRFLTSYGTVYASNMGDEMRFYDEQLKIQANPKSKGARRVGDSVIAGQKGVNEIKGIPQRLIDIGAFQ